MLRFKFIYKYFLRVGSRQCEGWQSPGHVTDALSQFYQHMLPALPCHEQEALENSHCFWPRGLTWVQTHELAAFLRVLAVLLTSLGPLTQGSNTHLRLPSMAGTAQAWVISLGSEVEPFIHHIVFDIDTCLTCKGHVHGCVTSSTETRFPSTTCTFGENRAAEELASSFLQVLPIGHHTVWRKHN